MAKSSGSASRPKNFDALVQAIRGMESENALQAFLTDLCTPAELQALCDRWAVAQLLESGISYRKIYEQTGVSTATVTRVARSLVYGEGGYKKALANEKGGPA